MKKKAIIDISRAEPGAHVVTSSGWSLMGIHRDFTLAQRMSP